MIVPEDLTEDYENILSKTINKMVEDINKFGI